MTSELQCPCKSDCTTVVTFDCCGKNRMWDVGPECGRKIPHEYRAAEVATS